MFSHQVRGLLLGRRSGWPNETSSWATLWTALITEYCVKPFFFCRIFIMGINQLCSVYLLHSSHLEKSLQMLMDLVDEMSQDIVKYNNYSRSLSKQQQQKHQVLLPLWLTGAAYRNLLLPKNILWTVFAFRVAHLQYSFASVQMC